MLLHLQISKKYGPVCTVYFGLRPTVVVTGYEALKEVFTDCGDAFLNRGAMPVFDRLFKYGGLSYVNGDPWKQLRQFSLQTLKDFGMGKKSLEDPILEEAHHIVEHFRSLNKEPVEPSTTLICASSNILANILMGSRYDYNNKKWLEILQKSHEAFHIHSSVWGQLYDMYPSIMQYIPGPHQRMFVLLQDLKEMVRESIKNHKDTLDPACPRDYIDCFLIRMEQEKHNPSTHFSMKNFYTTAISLFVAGTETVSTTVRHGLLLLLKHPNVKLKVQEEIDQVIGRLRAPGSQDRESMPYTDAVIHEIHRYADVLPMNLPHEVCIPLRTLSFTFWKGTDVLAPLSFVLRDPKYFPEPFTFTPERFLDENGRLKKNEAFLVFSAGKRMCLGDGLARQEIFLTLTTLLQNFDISSPVDFKELDISPQMVGFSNFPRPFKISFVSRRL
ncbi:unnamed protein product [Staurois parvus]|uniref:Cytochrome P450 n=1 Tax=Staurois parvus TaxID=386267 RepID=A0ABN9DML8_9NEOB|nr:unnamed protein product [Staurois parvus]